MRPRTGGTWSGPTESWSTPGPSPKGLPARTAGGTRGLDTVLESLGYSYSSDFQVGYDDSPFFPWRGDRFSKVLQIPVHPLCEGGLLRGRAGTRGPSPSTSPGRSGRRVEAGEPAFVYGHPERRLGRHPEIIRELAEAVAGESLLWRTTLTEFARWWRWRGDRRWSVVPREGGRLEVQFEEWDPAYPLAMELRRGKHVAVIPLAGPRTPFSLRGLAYERREVRADVPAPTTLRGPIGIKAALRSALDWETVTPVEDLPKKGARRTAQAGAPAVEGAGAGPG